MPRSPRKTSSLNLYHVCNRGIDRRVIFDDDVDRERFIGYIPDVVDRLTGTLVAWCLMSNHFHFVVNMELKELSYFMREVTKGYAAYYNTKRERAGHLFQGRFRSQPINDASYLLSAVKYVHQNPEKAGICATGQYAWSSYSEYLTGPKLVCADMILGEFGSRREFVAAHQNLVLDCSLLDVDNGWRMTADEAYELACEVIGEERLTTLDHMNDEIRDAGLRELLAAHISPTCISKISGIPRSTIYRAGESA